ncbi:hypothetical protein Pelo_6755 [Pelomyxa schiedti]|nr:hypothetical protein Pelo_6755 [Pelomyxa schiedti]
MAQNRKTKTIQQVIQEMKGMMDEWAAQLRLPLQSPPKSSDETDPSVRKLNPIVVHPYAKFNADDARFRIEEQIRDIKQTLKSYSETCSPQRPENASPIRKYLSALKDRSQYSSQLNRLTNSITDAIQLAQQEIPQPPLKKIRNILDTVQRKFDVFLVIGEDEMPNRLTADLGYQNFNLSVSIEIPTWTVKVDLVHCYNSSHFSDTDWNNELKAIISNTDSVEFQNCVAVVQQLNDISEKTHADIGQLLRSLRSDLLQMHQHEIRSVALSPKSIANKGHGRIEPSIKGIRISYFEGPSGESDSLTISLEKSWTLMSLPTSSQITESESRCFFRRIDDLQPSYHVRFAMHLSSPAYVSVSTLCRILKATGIATNPPIVNQGIDFASVQQIVCSSYNLSQMVHFGNMIFQFTHEGEMQPAFTVHHIPFTYPQHVAPVLDILRQQRLYASLLQSCFDPKNSLQAALPELRNQKLSVTVHSWEDTDICRIKLQCGQTILDICVDVGGGITTSPPLPPSLSLESDYCVPRVMFSLVQGEAMTE